VDKFIIKVLSVLNIVVTSCLHLKKKFKFLHHLLMYLGRFECENQLFAEKDMMKSFLDDSLLYNEEFN